jgi:hypothetical protein
MGARRFSLWLGAWALPGLLALAALYEVALMVWGDYRGLINGDSLAGEDAVAGLAYMAMLVGVVVAGVHFVSPRVPTAIALLGPAAAAFAVARFYAYDPYYFPDLIRYGDKKPGATAYVLVTVAVALAVAALTRARPRAGSVVTAVLLTWITLLSLLLSDGH